MEFRDSYFPNYMGTYALKVAKETLKMVYKTEQEIITQDMLDE